MKLRNSSNIENSKAVTRRSSVKKVFFVLQSPFGVSCSFIKKKLQHRCFPVNIAKFFKKTFFIEHLRCLLLKVARSNLRLVVLLTSLLKKCIFHQFFKFHQFHQMFYNKSILILILQLLLICFILFLHITTNFIRTARQKIRTN